MRGNREALGYYVKINRGAWERIQAQNAPRMWTYGVLAVCVLAQLWSFLNMVLPWALWPVPVWLVAQSMLIIATRWDPQFDEVIAAEITSPNPSYWEAG